MPNDYYETRYAGWVIENDQASLVTSGIPIHRSGVYVYYVDLVLDLAVIELLLGTPGNFYSRLVVLLKGDEIYSHIIPAYNNTAGSYHFYSNRYLSHIFDPKQMAFGHAARLGNKTMISITHVEKYRGATTLFDDLPDFLLIDADAGTVTPLGKAVSDSRSEVFVFTTD
jgi:hypothetical protein